MHDIIQTMTASNLPLLYRCCNAKAMTAQIPCHAQDLTNNSMSLGETSTLDIKLRHQLTSLSYNQPDILPVLGGCRCRTLTMANQD